MSIERCSDICSSGTPSAARRSRASASSRVELGARARPDPRCRRGARNIADRSWRTSTSRQPSAEVMPGFGGTSTVGIDSSSRQRGAVQRPGAAEGDERELARVVAAPDRDQPHGVGHVRVGDRMIGVRGLDAARARAARRRDRGSPARRRPGRASSRRRSARRRDGRARGSRPCSSAWSLPRP